MGYTHYYYRNSKEIAPDLFEKIVKDCGAVCRTCEIPLAGWDGNGEPEFSQEKISFNGQRDCGHARRDLGITWPAQNAVGGIEAGHQPTGNWFAGAQLSKRTCDGDCSHETFSFPRVMELREWQKPGEKFFGFTKTAYKPYDIPVTACLIVAKHYLGGLLTVHSDGESQDWEDGRRLCQQVLGYGADFELDGDDDAE